VFKYLFPLLLVLMFGYACNNSNNELQTTEKEAFDPYSEIMNKADLLISKDTVEGEMIGSCWARESLTYKQFKEIDTLCGEAELITLTEHEKPNIRAYAFWFLAKRKYKDIGIIFNKLSNDNAEITLRYGSTQWIYKVNDFCYFVLSRNDFDNSTIKFSEKELEGFVSKNN
jgi:hypothetical protein